MVEAKQEKNLNPLEKEDIRNKRATGTTSLRDKQTGTRRMIHSARRGARYDQESRDEYRSDSGNLPDTKKEIRDRINKLKGYRHGRMFSRVVRGDLSHPESRKIRDDIEKQKTKNYIGARNAKSTIKKFER